MALALKLSLEESQTHLGEHPQLYQEFRLPRSEARPEQVARVGGPPCVEVDIYGVEGTRPAAGALLQINTLDQFHSPTFRKSAEEFMSPNSTCGLFTMAHSIIVPKLLTQAVEDAVSTASGYLRLTRNELETLVSAKGGLRDVDVVLPELREAMRWLHESREKWIAGHAADFPGTTEHKAYLRAWVANYEISDWLCTRVLPGSAVHFVRYNQWPEHADATHEESVRIAKEERQYGGSRADGKEQISYADGDVLFWVDSSEVEKGAAATEGTCHEMQRTRSKRCASHWRAFRHDALKHSALAPMFFPVDLNGHFVFCLACELQSEEDSSAYEKSLVVFNTTSSHYLDWPSMTRTFDLAFLDSLDDGHPASSWTML